MASHRETHHRRAAGDRPRASFWVAALASLLACAPALAGDLDPPPGAVAPTMRTLDEVYERADAAAAAAEGGATPAAAANPLPCATWPFPSDMPPTASVAGLPGAPGPLGLQLASMRYSVARPASTGGASGPVLVGDLVIVKRTDASSPSLQAACLTGAHLNEVNITFVRANTQPYLQFIFSDLVVREVRPAMAPACTSGYAAWEQVTLTFAAANVTSLETGASAVIVNPSPPLE